MDAFRQAAAQLRMDLEVPPCPFCTNDDRSLIEFVAPKWWRCEVCSRKWVAHEPQPVPSPPAA